MRSDIPETLRKFVSTKTVHQTWAKTFFCKPQAIFQPRTVDEIRELVEQARINGKTIMPVGSGHSPSDMTMTKEWLCNLDRFNQVLKKEEFTGPTKNGEGEEVKFVDLTVQAGCRIYELNRYLKEHELAIQNLGSISDQSMAGVISTGTHGSTQYHGLVSQQVVSIEIMNSAGKLITCSSMENTQLFKAAMLSLGKIGIITHVTLRTIPKYTIKSKQEIIKFDTLLKNWDTVWLDSEFIRVWWFPYSGNCVCWRASKSSEPLSAPRDSWYGTWFGRTFYESLLWISVHICPRLTPLIEKFVFKNQYGDVETLGYGDVAVQNSVEGLNMDCLFSQFVNEWSAPLNLGQEVLIKLNDVIQSAREQNRFYVHAPIEVRCSNLTYPEKPFVDDNDEPSLYPNKKWLAKRDRLSPGPIPGNNLRPYLDNSSNLRYDGDDASVTNDQLTLFINATMYRPFHTNVDSQEWYQLFEDIMTHASGRPHWAKNFIGVNGAHRTDEDLQKQLEFGGKASYSMKGFNPILKDWFGENLVEYNKVRKSMDPDNVFLSGRDWAVRNGILIDV